MFFKKNDKKNDQKNNENLVSPDNIDMENPDIEKHKKPVATQGLGADDYGDFQETHENNPELLDEVAEKEGIFIQYSYNGDDVREGLTVFQNATIMKRNLIYSAILLCVFFAYVVNMVKNPNETLSMFLAIMCVAVLGIIWILPKLHIKKIAEFTDKNQYNYTMTVYDNCVRLGGAVVEGREDGSFLYSYGKEITQIYETTNLFLICAGKEQIFILPKRYLNGAVPGEENDFPENEVLSGDMEEKLRTIFQIAMNDKFISKVI